MKNIARRYLAVIQDPKGYPPRGALLEPAPPEGPAPPVIHEVVLATDYERLRAALEIIVGECSECSEQAQEALNER